MQLFLKTVGLFKGSRYSMFYVHFDLLILYVGPAETL